MKPSRLVGALSMVRRRHRQLASYLSYPESWKLALRDMPGRSHMADLALNGYPPLRCRYGTTDLRVAIQVLLENGYDSPFDLRDPVNIIDAGANIGYSAVWLATKYPSAQIIAIEPDVENFRLLEHNTRTFLNIKCVNAAVWSYSGRIKLSDPGSGPWACRASADAPGVEVTAISIDDLMQQYSIEHLDLLKMDIEGGEYEVFQSSNDFIEQTDHIAIELHEGLRPGVSSIFDRKTGAFSRRATIGETTFLAR